jgi:hypothetical protein
MVDFAAIHTALDEKIQRASYRGWDPFDGLNSRIFQATPLAKSRLCRLAWLQLFKRLPINLRGLACVPKVENAKAMAVLARSYIRSGQYERADGCIQRLLALRSDPTRWGQAAWGYPFDWQAKAFFVPKGTPNVICTTYAVLALEEAEQAGIIKDASPLIEAAATFVMQHLTRREGSQQFLAYIPESTALVYNASLWGAYILMAATRRSQASPYRETAMGAIENALSAQGKQGEWRYGTLPHHQFIDSFHTGYNLEALQRCNEILREDRITQSIEKGLGYYLQNFMDEEGCVGYYHHNIYPIDPHATAQWCVTLDCLKTEGYRALQAKALDYLCQHLWDEKRRAFHYQQQRYFRNRCDYLRWTQAWMHYALAIHLNGNET